MRYSSIALASLVALSTNNAAAFAPQPIGGSSVPTRLSASNEDGQGSINNNSWGRAVASAVVGLTFAAQVSGATVVSDVSDMGPSALAAQPTSTLVSVDTMDFSLPSYGDAMGGDVKSNAKTAPSFNPFGDFDFAVKKDADVAPAPAPAKEEPAPAKKFSMPKLDSKPPAEEEKEDAPALDLPKLPKVDIPKFEAPKIPEYEVPSVDLPKVDLPKVDIPKVELSNPFSKIEMPKAPEMPKLKAPDYDVELPKVPKFDIPKVDMPKVEMPKVDMPKVDMPKYDMDMPKVDVPKVDMPKVSVPNPFGGSSDSGSSSKSAAEPLAPREVRDERARATRQDFLAADQDVKDAEDTLRSLKQIREAKKDTAKAAKDLACADRPGGKLLCLRNPFSSGF